MNLIELLEQAKVHWRAGAEILVLWILIYQIYRVFRATRGARILIGLSAVMIALTLTSKLLELEVIGWILKGVATVLAFALLIIFQPELRNALARLGSTRLFRFSTSEQKAFLDLLADSAIQLSKKRFGALFAVQRTIELKNFAETGVAIDAVLSKELTATIFHHKTALHDGGMIIAHERVQTAGCVFPVSQKQLSDRSLGLRHRAGLGVSEESDAVAIIVSEETGALSICIDGKMERDLSEKAFRKRLNEIFLSSHAQPPQEVAREKLAGEDSGSRDRDRDLVSD